MRRAHRIAGMIVALAAASCGGTTADTLAVDLVPTAQIEPGSPTVGVATLNVLHGIFCGEDTDFCAAPARLEVLGSHLEGAGCPELVGLQEIGPRQAEIIPGWLEEVCGGAYEAVWAGVSSLDRAMVLTSLPVIEAGLLDLANRPWEAVWVRVEAAGGTVDFLTAHFASSANNPACDGDSCPDVCPAGIETNACHAREVVQLFDAVADPAGLTIVAGDLNSGPGAATVATLLDAGFVDAWAGNPECNPQTGAGCTGGTSGPDTPLLDMDTPDGLHFEQRIDYILVRGAADCRLEATAAAFAAAPLDPPIEGMYWSSDHGGVTAHLTCG